MTFIRDFASAVLDKETGDLLEYRHLLKHPKYKDPMDRYEYFRMKLELFPPDIIEEYGLRDKVNSDGNVFCAVRRDMYGLPQAGIIAQDLLTKRLNKASYYQSKITPGYWRHNWRPISFTLVVDDFGVKYINKADVEHLMSVLKENYEIDTDWEGTRYLGLTLDWDYIKREVHLSMPGYIENALIRFGHKPPDKPQLQPYPHTIPTYGATVQYAKAADTSPAATKAERNTSDRSLEYCSTTAALSIPP